MSPKKAKPKSSTTVSDTDSVYPGHPITIAFYIIKTFRSFDEAFLYKDSVLASPRVPGAAGNVWAALDLLAHLRGGRPIDDAFREADAYWERQRLNQEKAVMGQVLADRHKPELMTMTSWWQPKQ
jgi:hypothetical protein